MYAPDKRSIITLRRVTRDLKGEPVTVSQYVEETHAPVNATKPTPAGRFASDAAKKASQGGLMQHGISVHYEGDAEPKVSAPFDYSNPDVEHHYGQISELTISLLGAYPLKDPSIVYGVTHMNAPFKHRETVAVYTERYGPPSRLASKPLIIERFLLFELLSVYCCNERASRSIQCIYSGNICIP